MLKSSKAISIYTNLALQKALEGQFQYKEVNYIQKNTGNK